MRLVVLAGAVVAEVLVVAAVAVARSLVVSLIETSQVIAASELAEQRALPVLVVAGIAVVKTRVMDLYSPYFGSATAQVAHIAEAEGYLAVTDRAVRTV